MVYTIDNSGPPTAEQVTTFWDDLRTHHPKAELVASSLDAFTAEVLAGQLNQLPVVTEELGDSWLCKCLQQNSVHVFAMGF